MVKTLHFLLYRIIQVYHLCSKISDQRQFLKQSNALSRREIVRLREAPDVEGQSYTAPLGDLESGQLVVSAGISRLILHTDERMDALYQARFEGPMPDVKVKEGVVTIRYPRRLWLPGNEQRSAEITLSTAIPWRITIQGGASAVTAKLGNLQLAGLEVKGGLSMTRLELPIPPGVVPIRISGGASEIVVRRPAGVAARVHLKGWASQFIFDSQTFSDVGNDVRLQSTGYKEMALCYDIEVLSSASMVTIATD